MPAPLTAAAIERRQVAAAADVAVRHAANQLARTARFQVIGSTPREVRLAVRDSQRRLLYPILSLDAAGEVAWSCSCGDCTAAKPCACVVAGARAVTQYLRANPPQTWETRLEGLVAPSTPRRVRTTQLLAFSLQKAAWRWLVSAIAVPTESLPETLDRRDIAAVAQALVGLPHAPSNPPRDLSPERIPDATPGARDAARWIVSQPGYYGFYGRQDLSDLTLDRVLSQIVDAPVFLGDAHSPFRKPLTIHPNGAALGLETGEEADGALTLAVCLTLPDGAGVTPGRIAQLSDAPLWLLVDERLAVRVDGAAAPLLALAETPLTIPADEKPAFLARFLPRLAEQFPLTGALEIRETIDGIAPEPRVYLSEQKGDLVVSLRYGYGAVELAPERGGADFGVAVRPDDAALVRIVRDRDAESRHETRLALDPRLKRGDAPGEFRLRANARALDFILESVPALTADGFVVFGEESLTQNRVNRARPTLSWNVTSGIDWFDVDAVVTFGDTTASFQELRRAVRRRERFVRLADGSLGAIPEEWISRLRLTLGLGEGPGEGLRLSPLHAALLEETVRSLDGDLNADREFSQRLDALRSFDAIAPEPIPEGLVGELRPYQKAGYDWLRFLHRYRFGGCLADDMGTGKTIQALALLLSVRGQTPRQSLLVVPRSLVANWEREAARFAPDLKILRYDGNKRDRTAADFDAFDIVLTTYGVLLRDIEMLRAHRFQYVLLDEAQAIKNPLAHTSRAVRLLNAEHRLTLTGTPVENAAVELWSQFAFLNPGLLGSLDSFRESFGGAGDDEAPELTDLRALTRPFLLRRTKALVTPELPPRTERVHICEFEPAQRKLYEQTRDRYRAEILGLLDAPGAPGRTQLRILEGLLRLRQICCDPRLVEPATRAGSAKMDAVVEMLETLRAEGNKALVFSQFVQLLALLRRELDERKIPYLYLDGRTRDRQARVDAFQTDPDASFFLISLKAGGTGLNLTAADHVLHLDPWWNPAVEQQATDRAHRIGQDKPVFVTRFVARDTVEEKILTLQERKRELVQRIVADEAGFFKSLTRQDVEALFG